MRISSLSVYGSVPKSYWMQSQQSITKLVNPYDPYLADALIVTPSTKHFLHRCMFLSFLHTLKKNNCRSKEFIFRCSIKVHVLELSSQIFTLLHKFFQLVVVTLETLNVLVESLLCLVYGHLLIVHKFPLLILKNDTSLPSLEIPSFTDSIALCNWCFCEFAESPDSRL